ncbi:class I SAM-dependent methyltransferase [Chelativorans oligotrophicus]|uniref:class I SAM-dependent methyltransferase n=1 Tax=Chelativorans oligotrophicus TaxID=449974 RepID=UPI0014075DD5|nr:class I SAM-dependent methyltransferase [Chelativorans oligotrophicus]
MSFDVAKYWETINSQRRPIDFLVEFYNSISSPPPYETVEQKLRAHQREWMMLQIRRQGWNKLLDAGCGPGFWFQLWKELGLNASAVDRASTAQARAEEMSSMLEVNVPFECATLDKLPYADKSFDVVVTVKVLLHTPPEDIVGVMKELGRVASHLMLLERHASGKQKLREHVFEHDLRAIAESQGYQTICDEVHEGDQNFFVFKT